MKKKSIVASLCFISIFSISLDILDDNGRAGKTGSPGETTCNTTGCHVGNAVNAAGGSITIDCPSMPDWKYTPGQSYVINVIVERSGLNLFGLGFEALAANGANAGTFTITNSAQMTTKVATVSGNSRTSVVHKLNGGASANTHTFTFTWNAPSTDIGAITFYVAGNAANSSGTTAGDFIYTTSQIVNSPTTGIRDISMKTQAFKLYPNPATDRVNVVYTLQKSANVAVKLISLSGQEIYVNDYDYQTEGEHQLVISPQYDTPKGVYFIQLLIDGRAHLQKVIIE